MNSITGWVGAIGMATQATFYPQESLAESFSGKEFLGWTQAAQDSYFQTSITMAAIIATKTRQASGDCLADWYLSAKADRSGRNEELRTAISRNDAYHPSSVIFLILEGACGPFVEDVN